MIYESDLMQTAIVYSNKFSATADTPFISGLKSGVIHIPHNLGYPPLVTGYYSFTEDFAESYPIVISATTTIMLVRGLVNCDSSASDLLVTLILPENKNKVWIRLVGFQHPSYTGSTPVVNVRQDWRFDSDFKYPQAYITAVETSTTQVYHNLGFVPICMVWEKINDSTQANGYWRYCAGAFENVNESSGTLTLKSGFSQAAYILFKQG